MALFGHVTYTQPLMGVDIIIIGSSPIKEPIQLNYTNTNTGREDIKIIFTGKYFSCSFVLRVIQEGQRGVS